MQTQHTTAITVANSATIEQTSPKAMVFRVGRSYKRTMSTCGQSAYLFFSANETKTITLPIGYSSNDRIRFIAECDGTVEITVTHPTLGAQITTIKEGSFVVLMRITGVSITEKAGRNTTLNWSMFQDNQVTEEDFQ
jgi:hypothetical protein